MGPRTGHCTGGRHCSWPLSGRSGNVCVYRCVCASIETHSCLHYSSAVLPVAQISFSFPHRTSVPRFSSSGECLPLPVVFAVTWSGPRMHPVSHVCHCPSPSHRCPHPLRCPRPRGRPGFPAGPSLPLSEFRPRPAWVGSTSHTSPLSTGLPSSPAWAWTTCSERP